MQIGTGQLKTLEFDSANSRLFLTNDKGLLFIYNIETVKKKNNSY